MDFCGPPIVECGRKAVRVKAPVHPHLMSTREGGTHQILYWILIGFLPLQIESEGNSLGDPDNDNDKDKDKDKNHLGNTLKEWSLGT